MTFLVGILLANTNTAPYSLDIYFPLFFQPPHMQIM